MTLGVISIQPNKHKQSIFFVKLIVYLFTIFVLITSCKKEAVIEEPCSTTIIENHSYDTIFPSEYIMAYPGSWWEYDNGLIDSCEYWEAIPIRSTITSEGCLIVNEDMWVLPEALTYHGIVANDKSVYTPVDCTSTTFRPILDTTIGIFYQNQKIVSDGQYSYEMNSSAETIARLDSLTIGTITYYDVLQIEMICSIYYFHIMNGPTYTSQYWFAKNIGMIKFQLFQNGMPSSEGELIDYYIAPY